MHRTFDKSVQSDVVVVAAATAAAAIVIGSAAAATGTAATAAFAAGSATGSLLQFFQCVSGKGTAELDAATTITCCHHQSRAPFCSIGVGTVESGAVC